MVGYIKLNYFSDNLSYNFFLLAKYYSIFIKNIIPNFISGFLLKSTSLYIFINSFYLFLSLTFFKFNNIISFDALMDIVVVDYPFNVKKRFQLIYSF
jgi:hypothetical protein